MSSENLAVAKSFCSCAAVLKIVSAKTTIVKTVSAQITLFSTFAAWINSTSPPPPPQQQSARPSPLLERILDSREDEHTTPSAPHHTRGSRKLHLLHCLTSAHQPSSLTSSVEDDDFSHHSREGNDLATFYEHHRSARAQIARDSPDRETRRN